MYYGQASRYIIIIAGIFKVIESDAVIHGITELMDAFMTVYITYKLP